MINGVQKLTTAYLPQPSAHCELFLPPVAQCVLSVLRCHEQSSDTTFICRLFAASSVQTISVNQLRNTGTSKYLFLARRHSQQGGGRFTKPITKRVLNLIIESEGPCVPYG